MSDEPTIHGVEPNIIRPPLHQYITRDWRFWGALTMCLLVAGVLVALVVTTRSTVQQEGQVSDLSRSVAALTDVVNEQALLIADNTKRIADNDEAARCRSELAAGVNLANANLQVANAEQNVAIDRAFVASFNDDRTAVAKHIAELDGLAASLAESSAALRDAVMAQQRGLEIC